ncbi:MAG: UTP--glucose-1-phosphate uridylyltransferase, partial [Deltaproteobacteria bacterium]|nr:UTP--glucose-1-phosphate uridylyltransferase [Deltaproteobacteria bacterium]
YFGKIDMYNDRFKHGIPSLVTCKSLEIKGDFFFEENVQIRGRVVMQNRTGEPVVIKQGSVIEEDVLFS